MVMGKPVLGSTAGGAPGPFWAGAVPRETMRKKMAVRLCRCSLVFMVEYSFWFSVHPALARIRKNASKNLRRPSGHDARHARSPAVRRLGATIVQLRPA